MAALGPSAGPASAPDSTFEQRGWERSVRLRGSVARWIGWRLRVLVVGALAGCLGLFLLLRGLTAQPALDVDFTAAADGSLQLAEPAARRIGALIGSDGAAVPLDGALAQRSLRWLTDDAFRAQALAQHDALAAAVRGGELRLVAADGSPVAVTVQPRGAAGLGWAFWLYAAAALLLYLVTLVVVCARPDLRNTLFAAMALTQCGNLVLLAIGGVAAPGWPEGWMRWDLALRTLFDLAGAAALVHVTTLYPRRATHAGPRALLAWGAAALVAWGATRGGWAQPWAWTQATLLAAAATAVWQLVRMQRRRAHPMALQLLRLTATAGATLLLLTVLVLVIDRNLAGAPAAGSIGNVVWVLFVWSMLVLLPFLSRTQSLLREFSLIAGVATVATALDLLFVAVFSLGNFASLTLALFVALAVYAAVRQWLMNRLMSRQRLTTERMFEHLYRMARDVQSRPREAGAHLARLLRELFDPLHVQTMAQPTRHARVVADGASLVVPMPPLPGSSGKPTNSLVLGFAERGRRLFTVDDARLADRIVDQVARAIDFDQAVERGRTEERVRIAQDLHDDIGARLLTLMYQAPTPEMEDYLRHTLKDLKTLTRGLAAANHPLSHAVAEWKADITQRLVAADCELAWSFSFERDFDLGVVQWSALTRILRELVSNAIAHAHATRVEIAGDIERGSLSLTVADNGIGTDPAGWSHGLGLGGVRKRVKQMGGDVQWARNTPQGIVCRVVVPAFAPRRGPGQAG
jgi:signal transduction histidine kinase